MLAGMGPWSWKGRVGFMSPLKAIHPLPRKTGMGFFRQTGDFVSQNRVLRNDERLNVFLPVTFARLAPAQLGLDEGVQIAIHDGLHVASFLPGAVVLHHL